ncbi:MULTISPECIES: type II toxin-antitoxin system HicB family antitoxin [Nocardia]|uniref:HicB family protein n=1 Tax=Nocardia nova TaxID=37330 RepID=A0A2T2Z897_9NOCA|nr:MULTISPECIES: hypothetical protein [Nocardia]PSR63982.1 HicB family protein [Nocardia nova]
MTTTYNATATRDGRWWAVEIEGLPPNMVGVTQGRDLEEAKSMAREVVALLLDVPEDEIDIDLRVAGTEGLLDELAQARAAKEAAARAEQETLAKVAQNLTGQGITQRDAAQLLGLSPQRVAQLAPRRTDVAFPAGRVYVAKKVSAPKVSAKKGATTKKRRRAAS